ncbi:MAG: Disulfide bond formation protein DsbB [Actinomycetia bacterium]|nr:Disulfide bond formation protein DsbB [Actinomycetes bacterium]
MIDPPLSGFTNAITYVFVALTYIADGLVVAAILLGVAALVSRAARDSVDRLVYVVGPYARVFAFLVAAVCMSGSLYYSLGAHFTPCEMCWYQRICMYPLVVVLGVGAWTRERSPRIIGFIVAGIGVVLSSYHWALERGWVESATACSTTVPCSVPWFTVGGFMTLAWMALSGFLLIGLLLLVDVRYQQFPDAPDGAEGETLLAEPPLEVNVP